MLKIAAITRTDLIAIAKASEFSTNPEVLEFIATLEERGQYTEATDDEIETYDELYDRLYAASCR